MNEQERLASDIMIEIERAICEALFGMTRGDFIAEAVEFAGEDWQLMDRDNLIDHALDWLHIDALNAYVSIMRSTARALRVAPVSVLTVTDTIRESDAVIRMANEIPLMLWSKTGE